MSSSSKSGFSFHPPIVIPVGPRHSKQKGKQSTRVQDTEEGVGYSAPCQQKSVRRRKHQCRLCGPSSAYGRFKAMRLNCGLGNDRESAISLVIRRASLYERCERFWQFHQEHYLTVYDFQKPEEFINAFVIPKEGSPEALSDDEWSGEDSYHDNKVIEMEEERYQQFQGTQRSKTKSPAAATASPVKLTENEKAERLARLWSFPDSDYDADTEVDWDSEDDVCGDDDDDEGTQANNQHEENSNKKGDGANVEEKPKKKYTPSPLRQVMSTEDEA